MNKPKYPPPLDKKRTQQELPGLLTEDLQVRINQIDQQAIRQDIEGLWQLADHYADNMAPWQELFDQMGIAPGQAQFMALSLCLARDHVPGLQTANKRGRKPLNEDQQAEMIATVTQVMVEKDCSLHAACGVVDKTKANSQSPTYDYLNKIQGGLSLFGMLLVMLDKGYISAAGLNAFATSDRTADDLPDIEHPVSGNPID